MANQTLEANLARLNAIEDIKQLKARYCAYCDAGYDADGIASLFVEDAVWDGSRPGFGRYVGREAIRKFFREEFGSFLLVAHLVMNPIIVVNGNTATGQWRLFAPLTVKNPTGQPEARWLLGSYDESYVEHNGTWLFKTLTFNAQFYAAHETGWAQGSISDMHE